MQLTAVHWCSAQFGMPLKTEKAPHGIFTPQELYLVLSAFFIRCAGRPSQTPLSLC